MFQLTRSALRRAPRFNRFSTSTPEPFRVLFCGSDSFSQETLQALLAAEDLWKDITVLTPAERQIDRGKKRTYIPPLKLFALERGLEHYDVPSTGLAFPPSFAEPQPNNVLLTASFGSIIPTQLLRTFKHAINVHPSVLPKYRGAAPLQWAIANGDSSTGVSVQTMATREDGVDSGSILGAVDTVPIRQTDTYNTLLPDLSHIGGRLLVQVLRGLRDGTVTAIPQDGEVIKAPKITTKTARIDWRKHSASHLDARHRGFGHHAPLWAELGPSSVQFISLRRAERPEITTDERPGLAVFDKPKKRVLVATVDGWVEVERVKPAGRKEAPASEWWNGLAPEARKQGWTVFE